MNTATYKTIFSHLKVNFLQRNPFVNKVVCLVVVLREFG